MRIGIDIRSLQNDSRLRGIGTYTRELINALAGAAPDDEFVFFAYGNRPLPVLPARATVRRVTSLRKRFVWLSGQILFPAAARREKLDIFYSPEYIVPVWCRCPKVITVHDFINREYPAYRRRSGILRRAYFYLKDRTLESADGIIAVSRYTQEKIREFARVDPRKVRVIHEAAGPEFVPRDDPERSRALREKYALDGEYLLYVGAVDYHKNIDGLIAAFAAARRCRALLVLAGVQHDPAYLRRVTALAEKEGVLSRARFLGYVPQGDLVGLYNAAMAFISVSVYEGFGLPCLEAMSCGVPVICAGNTSMAEIVADAGVLVDPFDRGAIAAAIERISADREWRAGLGAAALGRSRRFTWEKTAAETMGFFKELRDGR